VSSDWQALYKGMNPLGINPDRTVEPAPDATAFDHGMTVAKVAALALPFAGPGVALLDAIITPLRGRRMSDWCEKIRLGLNDLSQRIDGLTPERLAKDEAFVSAFGQATQAVLRTHQVEKREALRNAVLNVAIGKAPSDDKQLVFLNLIDRFTPIHLQILSFLGDRTGSSKPVAATDLSNQVVLDLNNSGLLQNSQPYAARGRDYADLLMAPGANWTVNSLGTQFLEFIKSPVTNA
jgi:hypothetical protein